MPRRDWLFSDDSMVSSRSIIDFCLLVTAAICHLARGSACSSDGMFCAETQTRLEGLVDHGAAQSHLWFIAISPSLKELESCCGNWKSTARDTRCMLRRRRQAAASSRAWHCSIRSPYSVDPRASQGKVQMKPGWRRVLQVSLSAFGPNAFNAVAAPSCAVPRTHARKHP